MLIKTYHGPDLPGVLSRVRAELGADALVLGTSERPGRLGLPVVEVTAAVPRESVQPERGGDTTLAALASEIRQLRGVLGRNDAKAPGRREKAAAPRRATPAADTSSNANANDDSQVEALVATGLARDLARRLGGSRDSMTRGLAQLLSFAPLPADARCLFVVGPPGAGKTTTVAKVVARQRSAGRPVWFAVADHDRIGGLEQARIYSRHIGASMVRIDSPGALRSSLARAGDHGLVVVDTCGVGGSDATRLRELRELRSVAPDAAMALLLQTGLHRDEAARVMERFDSLDPTCIGLSRTDDGSRPGELVTALAGRKLPLAIFTTGHAVPDDMERATPRQLAALLLRGGSRAVAPMENHA